MLTELALQQKESALRVTIKNVGYGILKVSVITDLLLGRNNTFITTIYIILYYNKFS